MNNGASSEAATARGELPQVAKKIRRSQEYFFPAIDIFYSAISKNASSSVLAMLLRQEEAAQGSTAAMRDLARYLPIKEDVPVRVWEEYDAILKSYRSRSSRMTDAFPTQRLVILRNPAKRLASAWINKFFMLEHVTQLEHASYDALPSALTMQHVVDAFNRFVQSLTLEIVSSHIDSHLAAQSLYVQNLTNYSLVIGMNQANELPQLLRLGAATDTFSVKKAVPEYNSAPRMFQRVLLSEENLAKIVEVYAEDFQLLESAVQFNPRIQEELTLDTSPIADRSELVSANIATELTLKRDAYRSRFMEFERLRKIKRTSKTAGVKRAKVFDREPVALYLLCHNEEILLPEAVRHYRGMIPNVEITILDNESTDNSVLLAQQLGCRVRTWSSENQIDDHKFVLLKNNIWKERSRGWVIMADMDEWLCATADDLAREAARGVTVLRVYGLNMVAESNRIDLSDIDLHSLTLGFHMSSRDKLVAFRRPDITEMNYGIGAHQASPQGIVVLSTHAYVLKHMERLGLPWLRDKWTKRFARATKMQAEGIALHYSAEDAIIVRRQETALRHARQRSLTPVPPGKKKRLFYVWQRMVAAVKHGLNDRQARTRRAQR